MNTSRTEQAAGGIRAALDPMQGPRKVTAVGRY
jgi:hypothetical protein